MRGAESSHASQRGLTQLAWLAWYYDTLPRYGLKEEGHYLVNLSITGKLRQQRVRAGSLPGSRMLV